MGLATQPHHPSPRCDPRSCLVLTNHLPFPFALDDPVQVQSQQENRTQRSHKTDTQNTVARLLNRRLLEAHREVPNQVADTIRSVEEERPGDDGLERGVDEGGQVGSGLGEGRALDVPAGQRRGEVGKREGVEGGAEGLPRDARPDRGAEPGLRVVVGGQVRGDGAGAPLRGEEGLAVFDGEFLGRGGSVGGVG